LYRVTSYPICLGVTHAIRGRQKLLAHARRIRGQIEAVERALDAEADCERVMHLLASTCGAMSGLMAEVVEEHVRTHLVDVDKHLGVLDEEAVEQLLGVVRTYMK